MRYLTLKKKVSALLLIASAITLPMAGFCAQPSSADEPNQKLTASDRYASIQKLLLGSDHRNQIQSGIAAQAYLSNDSSSTASKSPFGGLARLASSLSSQGAQTGLAAIASDEPSNVESKLWALHKNLPVSSLIRITNESNGQSIVAEVKGSLAADASSVVELSPEAFKAAGLLSTSKVRVEQVIMP